MTESSYPAEPWIPLLGDGVPGALYVVDRKKDLINASGSEIWSREVEDVLRTRPAVREAAVVSEVEILAGLPKAASGKILRWEPRSPR